MPDGTDMRWSENGPVPVRHGDVVRVGQTVGAPCEPDNSESCILTTSSSLYDSIVGFGSRKLSARPGQPLRACEALYMTQLTSFVVTFLALFQLF